MSGERDPPVEREGGTRALLEALDVRRNARRGFAVGAAVAVAVYVFFVVIPGTYRSPLWYVALAAVLAVGTGALATALLLVASARRLAKDL